MSEKEFERYNIRITGAMPLLMHQDNLKWGEVMKQWEMDPANQKISVKGDDRTPSIRWMGCLYRESGYVVIPSDNLMTAMREGGAKTPTGKRGATFKRQSQSGIMVDQSSWVLEGPKGPIETAPWFDELKAEKDFAVHEQRVRDVGFELFVKRARIGQSKHVRVRPRFDVWSAAGSVTVTDMQITKDILTTILITAGALAGLGDWRPSSPSSPGPYGRFKVEVTK